MGFFDKFTGKCSELENILFKLESNMSNNYKDAAQADYKKLGESFQQLVAEGKLNDKQKARYSDILATLAVRMKNFTHKDQTPYWT